MSDQPELVRDVADTAFMVAAFRAEESKRPDPLFRDPLAGRVAGERGRAIASSMAGGLRGWPVVIRTVIIDELVERALEHVDVVLNLGAGLDTRPYRMDLPATLRWIEVDQPAVIEWKEECLRDETPRCRLERVALDLSDTEARARFLGETFADAERVLVITEGVIPYLTEEQVLALATDLYRAANIYGWIVDYIPESVHRFRARSGVAMRNAPFRFRPADWFAFFQRLGWDVGEMHYLGPTGDRLGRPLPLPRAMLLVMRAAQALRRIRGPAAPGAGYAMLVRRET